MNRQNYLLIDPGANLTCLNTQIDGNGNIRVVCISCNHTMEYSGRFPRDISLSGTYHGNKTYIVYRCPSCGTFAEIDEI